MLRYTLWFSLKYTGLLGLCCYRARLFHCSVSDAIAALNICYVQALLHAISKGLLEIVRVIVDHPTYSLQETQKQESQTDSKPLTEERIQYKCSPDITPAGVTDWLQTSYRGEDSVQVLARHHAAYACRPYVRLVSYTLMRSVTNTNFDKNRF